MSGVKMLSMFRSLMLIVCSMSKPIAEESTALPSERPDELHTEFTIASPTNKPLWNASVMPFGGSASDTTTLAWIREWAFEYQTEMFPFYSNLEDRKALYKKLRYNYDKNILPYSGKDAFNIAINVSLVAVGEIDEIEEKLSSVLRLNYKWNDENRKWSLDEHNITYVTFGWRDVWKPVLRVDNPHVDSSNRQTSDRHFDSVIYNSNGSASFEEMMVTRTTCDLYMTYYPFDIQKCTIQLSVVGASKFPFRLNVHLNEYLSSSDAKHGSWVLIYKGTITSKGGFEIELKFERRPSFILLNILLPIIVLALLTPLVFVLPKKSGERVGFSIAMLLAISVYMTIVSDHLQQNSEPLPLIVIMMFIWYITDALVVFIVIINSRINTMNPERLIPNYIRRLVRLTRKVLYSKRKYVLETGLSEGTKKCIDDENTDEKESSSQNGQHKQNEVSNMKDSTNVTWRELSHCVDRWCFVICYIIKLILPVVFFPVMKSYSTM